MIRRILLLASLAVGTAAAQTGRYSVVQFGAITMTASGQTSAAISFAPQGGAYSAGTITITGVGLTTATVGVLGSSDGGVTFFPLNIAPITSLTTTATTATITATSLYAVNLATITNLKFVTSGTFTATSITLKLAASPNGLLSRNNASPPCAPVSAWPMTEGSGLTLNDTSGNSNTATINSAGSVTWQANAGFTGVTPRWNGTGFATSASTTLTSFTGLTPFTMHVKESNTMSGVAAAFMSTLNVTAAAIGWEFGMSTSGTALFAVIFSIGSNGVNVSGSVPINTGAARDVTVTYDGSQHASGVKFYIDGVADTNAVAQDNLTLNTSNGLPITFGKRNDNTSELTGAMASVKIYPCLFNAAQAAALR